MEAAYCSCATPTLRRGSLLCGSCFSLAVPTDVANRISQAAHAAAIAQGVVGRVPVTVLPGGGFRQLDPSFLSAYRSLFEIILPFSDVLSDLVAEAAAGAVALLIHQFRKLRKQQDDIRDVCLAVFASYFSLSTLPQLADLAKRIPLAERLHTIITKHVAAGQFDADMEAILGNQRSVLDEIADEHPTSTLLRATILFVRSKMKASAGDLRSAYEDLKAVRKCDACMRELRTHLGAAADHIIARQLLNHSYLLAAKATGKLTDTSGYASLIAETKNLLKEDFPLDAPPLSLSHWSKFGDIGPGLGLHFGNAAFHQAIVQGNDKEAKQILRQRFALAQEWDREQPSQTSWNQFSQVAGQALFMDDAGFAREVLGYAAARAGRFDYEPAVRYQMVTSPNRTASQMAPLNLEWLLHCALREQAAGRITAEHMLPGTGDLLDIEARLRRLGDGTRFRRISWAIYARVFPERRSYLEDAFFPPAGEGTDIFFPKAPRDFVAV